MEIRYSHKKLEKQLTDPKAMLKSFGTMARKVNQRLQELSAVENLEMLKTLPSARCHELHGDLWGLLSVDVSVNYRLLFRPNHQPIPKKVDGGLDWTQITRIEILRVEDYH